MLRLKLKFGSKSFDLSKRFTELSPFEELHNVIWELTSIPTNKQKILRGFPPQPMLGSQNSSLISLGLQNGDVLILEECAPAELDANNEEQILKMSSIAATQRGILQKKIVPSDNSCLFASVYCLMNEGNVQVDALLDLRKEVAAGISQQPELYNEAVLEKSNPDYCEWIMKETSWGGAIELSILCDLYKTEIVTVDAKSGTVSRFGEDKNYNMRILLMYDGIHYDPLYLEGLDGLITYIFSSSDIWLLEEAQRLASEAKRAGHFTDTQHFQIKCSVCHLLLRGEAEATEHAKLTSHCGFTEVSS